MPLPRNRLTCVVPSPSYATQLRSERESSNRSLHKFAAKIRMPYTPYTCWTTNHHTINRNKHAICLIIVLTCLRLYTTKKRCSSWPGGRELSREFCIWCRSPEWWWTMGCLCRFLCSFGRPMCTPRHKRVFIFMIIGLCGGPFFASCAAVAIGVMHTFTFMCIFCGFRDFVAHIWFVGNKSRVRRTRRYR